jgi:hypothetical protein
MIVLPKHMRLTLSSQGKNLESLVKAIKQHDESCDFPAIAVMMNPFEIERLGWEEIMGIEIKPDSKLPTGRFRIICDGETVEEDDEAVEAIMKERDIDYV